MKTYLLALAGPFLLSCQSTTLPSFISASPSTTPELTPLTFEKGSWPYFLQHLPLVKGKVVDYRGTPIHHQQKAAAIVNYDIGTKDLQQCADALIRLRAEYLFAQQRFTDIHFQFTSGQPYAFADYCKGMRPIPKGAQVSFAVTAASVPPSSKAFRRYLDIVYTYAGTISLYRELKDTPTPTVGTVILTPGSPGHCCIVVDEATAPDGTRLYKLVEGYTPAQSIYVLRNPDNGSEWHAIKAGRPITTASYLFEDYVLKQFE